MHLRPKVESSNSSTSIAGSVTTIPLSTGSSVRIADFAILKLQELQSLAKPNSTRSEHVKVAGSSFWLKSSV